VENRQRKKIEITETPSEEEKKTIEKIANTYIQQMANQHWSQKNRIKDASPLFILYRSYESIHLTISRNL